MLHIYVDADACPVKNEVYRVSKRYNLEVTIVTNTWMRIPNEKWVNLKLVESGPDIADDWIVENVQQNDIVITSDIPLASRCIDKEARVITSSGKEFNENNISQAVATRNLMTNIRSTGEITSGPPPLKKSDRSRFLQLLDEVIQSIQRKNPN